MLILFFEANPSRDLDLNKEIALIKRNIERAVYRDEVITEFCLKAGVEDVIQNLATKKPNIVHFSGHAQGAGSEQKGQANREMQTYLEGEAVHLRKVSSNLILNGTNGTVRELSPPDLVKILEGHPEIRLVFFNSCHSKAIAETICEKIDCVVGTPREIKDEVAINFSAQFYLSLANGKSVKKAYDDAFIVARQPGVHESELPILTGRKGVDLLKLFMIGGHHERESSFAIFEEWICNYVYPLVHPIGLLTTFGWLLLNLAALLSHWKAAGVIQFVQEYLIWIGVVAGIRGIPTIIFFGYAFVYWPINVFRCWMIEMRLVEPWSFRGTIKRLPEVIKNANEMPHVRVELLRIWICLAGWSILSILPMVLWACVHYFDGGPLYQLLEIKQLFRPDSTPIWLYRVNFAIVVGGLFSLYYPLRHLHKVREIPYHPSSIY